jgi:hypothetical protein
MFTEAYYKEFCRIWKNYHVYDIEVSDENHIGSLIEHGDFFATSMLAKISHH